MQKYKLTNLTNLTNLTDSNKIYKKLYKFQHGGLDLLPESEVPTLNLQELQLVDVPAPTPIPVKVAAPVKVESGMKVPPIIIPNPSSDKIESLITPPPSPLVTTSVIDSITAKPKAPFTPIMLFEIILENLLGKPERYRLYSNDIKEYFKKIKAIYIIDSENLRYKFIEKNFKKPIDNEQHQKSWGLMFNYLLDKIMKPDNLVLLCGNTHWLYKNLNDNLKNKTPPQSIKSYPNIFTIYFKQDKPEKNFSASDDLIFWIFAMAFRKIIGESCNEYQSYNKKTKLYTLNASCKLHLITGDKQKLSDDNVKSGKPLKNFYTEFMTHDKSAVITFYLNNNLNSTISDLLKLFLSRFIEKSHVPMSYIKDPLGITFIEKCSLEKCDFFERFISNVKTLQKLYFPPCDKSCICISGKGITCPQCSCAVAGEIITELV